jgi:hypothetical protein
MRSRGSGGVGSRRQQRCEGDTPSATNSLPALLSCVHDLTLALPYP